MHVLNYTAKGLVDMNKDLEMGRISWNNSEWAECNHSGLYKREAKDPSQRRCDNQARGQRDAASSQGIWHPLGRGKGKEADFPLEPPQKNAALPTPRFEP